MAQLIDIPNVGQIEFPDTMSEAAISVAAKKLHDEALTQQEIAPIPVSSAQNLPPPEQVKLPSGEQALKEQSERFNQAFLSGALGVPAMGLQAMQGMEQNIPVYQELQKAGIPFTTLSEDIRSSIPKKLEEVLTFHPRDLSEMAVQFGGGAFSPEAPLLATDPLPIARIHPISKIPTKTIASHIDDPTIAPMLKKAVSEAVDEQANLEKQLNTLVGNYQNKTGTILNKEIAAKVKSAERIDRLSQEAAIATIKKEAQINKLNQKLALYSDVAPLRFDEKLSTLEGQRQAIINNYEESLKRLSIDFSPIDQARAKLIDLDQEIETLLRSRNIYTPTLATDAAKLNKIEGRLGVLTKQREAIKPDEIDIQSEFDFATQKLKEDTKQKLENISALMEDLTISRGMSQDQRILKRQALQQEITQRIKQATLQEKVIHGQLSKQATQEIKDLQIERIDLLKTLKNQREMKVDINETSNKLRENLLKQHNIKQAIESSKIPVVDKVDFTRTFGAQNTPELIHDMAMKRVNDLETFVKQGIITKENLPYLRQAIYDETLKVNGIKLKSEKLSKLNLLGELYRWGEVQRKTGVPTGESTQKLVIQTTNEKNYVGEHKVIIRRIARESNKLGITPETLLNDLQYFRTQADGTYKFDPTAINIPGKVAIPETVKQFTPQQQQHLASIRKYFDEFADDLGLPKLPGYIPLREKPQYLSVSTKTTAEKLRNPALERARTSGEFIPGIHETDFITVMDQYINEAGRKKFTAPVLNDGVKTLTQLHLSNLPHEAENFKKYLLEMLNINGEKEAAEIFGDYKLGQIKPDLDAFVKQLPDPDGALEQITAAVHRAVYHNLLLKPKSIIKQYLQAPVMGSIELGFDWWASGVKSLFNKSRLNHAQKVLNASLIKDVGQLEEQIAKTPTNVVSKVIDFINKPQEWASRKTIGAGERANRLQTILAAENKFDHAWQKGREAALDSLLKESALTTAQRALISRSFLTGGMENARDMYALLMTQRVNFTYSVADKPELLRNALGQLFPFTTYPRNVLARATEAYKEGKPVYLIKQVAYPLALLIFIETMWDRTLPAGSMPIESVSDIATRGFSPLPYIVGESPIQTLTPLPRNLIKFDLKKGPHLDPNAAKKAIERDLEVFPKIKDSPSELYKWIGKKIKD